MKLINRLLVTYQGRSVGYLSSDNNQYTCSFQYHHKWLLDGFSISPLELPLTNDV